MVETDDSDPGSVILKDLELFNKSVVYFEEKIQPEFVVAASKVIEVWLNNHGWKGDITCDYITEMWIAPIEWQVHERKKVRNTDFSATFSLEYEEDDDNSYEMANLFGVGGSPCGFRIKCPKWKDKKLTDAQKLLLESCGWTEEKKRQLFQASKITN